MKKHIYPIHYLAAIILSILYFTDLQAQEEIKKKYKRVSTDLGVGSPIVFGSIDRSYAYNGYFGLRYSVTKYISLQGLGEVGQLVGLASPRPINYEPPSRNSNNYIDYTNNFFQYSINAQFCFTAFPKIRKAMPNFNIYGVIGMGRMQSAIRTTALNQFNEEYKFDIPARSYYSDYYGLIFRYNINNEWDFTTTIKQHITQTAIIDGVPAKDLNFDHLFMPSIGFSYKIARERKTMNLIDWYIPENNPITQKYDYKRDSILQAQKIDSLIKANNKLVTKNQELDSNLKIAQTNLDKFKKENDSLKTITQKLATPNSSKLDSTQLTPPPFRFNVVVGSYSNFASAVSLRDDIRKRGYPNTNIYVTPELPNVYRIIAFSTSDYKAALQVKNRIAKNVVSNAWIYTYNAAPKRQTASGSIRTSSTNRNNTSKTSTAPKAKR